MRKNNFLFGCLIETRVRENKSIKIVSSVFQDWEFMANYEYNNLGRLWVVWQQSVRLTPVYKSDQLITCSVLLSGESEEFLCSFVYALNTMEERRRLWEEIKNRYEAPMFKKKRWVIMGDYNEILEDSEHSEFGNLTRQPVGITRQPIGIRRLQITVD